ncbi:MAG: hypothetical protein V9G08_03990 [Dermatophilaceae bacterium]
MSTSTIYIPDTVYAERSARYGRLERAGERWTSSLAILHRALDKARRHLG